MVSSLTDAGGVFRPLADIVEEMDKSMTGLSATSKLSKLIEVLGLRAGPAMAALVNQGSDAIRDFERQLESAGGTADRIRRTQLDNLIGDFVKFRSILQGIGIEVYNVFRKDLRKAMQSLTEYFRKNKTAIVEWANVLRDKLIKAKNFLLDFVTFAKTDWVAATDFMWTALLEGLKAVIRSAVSMAIVGGKSIMAGIRMGLTGDPISRNAVGKRADKILKEEHPEAWWGPVYHGKLPEGTMSDARGRARQQLEQELIDDIIGGNLERISGYFATAINNIKVNIPPGLGQGKYGLGKLGSGGLWGQATGFMGGLPGQAQGMGLGAMDWIKRMYSGGGMGGGMGSPIGASAKGGGFQAMESRFLTHGSGQNINDRIMTETARQTRLLQTIETSLGDIKKNTDGRNQPESIYVEETNM